MAVTGSLSLALRAPEDVLWAKQEARRFAAALPFGPDDLARIEISVSELASNIIKHAHGGRLEISRVTHGDSEGVRVVAIDKGPGIDDLDTALKPGYSTAGSLGVGLSAVQEHMDKFEITSKPGQGTRVEVEKWLR
jgi:serine/threonine-protein kinase RsbT